jgi:hypothetical protein
VSSFADARVHQAANRDAPNRQFNLGQGLSLMRMVVMAVMVVVPMMRRIRQRDVCEKNQCDHEANNLTHDWIPTFLCRGTPATRIASEVSP